MSLIDIEVPPYITINDDESLNVKTSDWEGSHENKITIDNIVLYYATEINGMSGMRTLGGISGDWRMVDNLAQEILQIFKDLNREQLDKIFTEQGMTLRD